MSHPGFQALERARQEVELWASFRKLPLHRIEFVATFEDWDDGVGVWVFLTTDADLRRAKTENLTGELSEVMLTALREADYPFDTHPKVVFEYDSHENVKLNYQGSYFYRLR